MDKRSLPQVAKTTHGNKLRQYPSPRKGKGRMFPFAQPRMTPGVSFAPGASVFVAGSCFARNIERALEFAGVPVLSSSEATDMPSPPGQIAKWFNKFNTDTVLNEMRWALDAQKGIAGGHKRGSQALLEYEGEWSDMQIGWTFAHAKKQAKHYRRAYNAAFDGVASADVVILTAGSVECWYDAQDDLYMNAMVPGRVSDLYPDRFELHVFGFAEAYAACQRVYDLLMNRPGKPPVLIFAVSAVAQPATYTGDDALVSNMASQAIQRAAVDAFVKDHPDVGYLPAYEACVLADRKFAYQDNTFNHTRQEVMDRAVADMLTTCQGPTEGASALMVRGQVASLHTAEDGAEAHKLAEAHAADWGETAVLDPIRARAAFVAGESALALQLYLRAAQTPGVSTPSLVKTAFNLAVQLGAKDAATGLVEQAADLGLDAGSQAEMNEKLSAKAETMAASAAAGGQTIADKALAAEMDGLLNTDPAQIVERLGMMLDDGQTLNDKLRWTYARALMKTDRRAAIAYLKTLLEVEFKYARSASSTLINLMKMQPDTDAEELSARIAEHQTRYAIAAQ